MTDVVRFVEHRCHCPTRELQERTQQFVFSPRYRAYIFPAAPHRRMTRRTRQAVYIERGDLNHPDHGGEPWRYVTCPWCLGELLPPEASPDPPLANAEE